MIGTEREVLQLQQDNIQKEFLFYYETNKEVKRILLSAIAALTPLNLSIPSAAPGYDLSDIIPALQDMMPDPDTQASDLLDSAVSRYT